MSGPVAAEDAAPAPAVEAQAEPAAPVEVWDARPSDVGGLTVHRSLPRRPRRTIGAWCFVDHFGPVDAALRIGPHPHIGLHTVTWLLEGEVLHTDSLGREQPIRPGQLNLMTAGRGIAHAEDGVVRSSGRSHGIQLWVAQPESTRHGPPAFEHHAELPALEVPGAVGTVLVGELAASRSPARADTPMMGADLELRGTAVLPLEAGWEHGVVVVGGTVEVGGTPVGPNQAAHLPPGRDELRLRTADGARLLLLGGVPFAETVLMWWNFVARTREEVDEARDAWEAGADRFGEVATGLDRIPAPPTPWGS